MITNDITPPRVARIEIHYEDGSSDMMQPIRGQPLYSWTRTSPTSNFKQHAYTSGAVAVVLFQTVMTRRLMPSTIKVKDAVVLARGLHRAWQEYAPDKPYGSEG